MIDNETRKFILQEISPTKQRINDNEKKLSDFTESKTDEVKADVIASEEALCDVDEAYDQRVADIEEALCELTEMLNL